MPGNPVCWVEAPSDFWKSEIPFWGFVLLGGTSLFTTFLVVYERIRVWLAETVVTPTYIWWCKYFFISWQFRRRRTQSVDRDKGV